MREHRLTPSACWHCGTVIDMTTGLTDAHRPYPGALSICVKCGQPSIFGLELKLRAPSEDEWLEIGADERVQRMLKATKAFLDGRRH